MNDTPDPSPVAPARALSPKWLSLTALSVSIIALLLAALPYANGTGDFGGRVRSYLLAHPEVLDEVVRARDLVVAAVVVSESLDAPGLDQTMALLRGFEHRAPLLSAPRASCWTASALVDALV